MTIGKAMIKEAIGKIKSKRDLSREEMEAVFAEIMGGKLSTDDIALFLAVLRDKGETVDEITGAAKIMRKFSVKVHCKSKHLIDTCGTGGDGKQTFNVSTISMFVVSASGIPVAKHGNKAVLSKCGSADLLQMLGASIDLPPEKIARCIDEIGIGFMYAPSMHPALKHAMSARKKLKTRTIFNILGPLTNPAGASMQLLGVYDPALVSVLGTVLKNLDVKKAMVVSGQDGTDEVSLSAETDVCELKDQALRCFTVTPEGAGLKRYNIDEFVSSSVDENTAIAKDVLKGKNGPKKDMVCFNAGCAIYIGGKSKSIKEGVEIARGLIDSGKAEEKMKQFVTFTASI